MKKERFEIEGFYRDVFEETYDEILIVKDYEDDCYYLISEGDAGMHFCILTNDDYNELKSKMKELNKEDFNSFVSNEDGDYKYRYINTFVDKIWQSDDFRELISTQFNYPYII